MEDTPNNPNVTIVKEASLSKFSQEIIIGKHILIADEPIAVGGRDAGPSPYDFLLAALGSCTSMTIRMYANLRFIPLKNVIVKLEHKKIHINDCVDCENDIAKVDMIDRQIELVGDLTQKQRDKLLEIANKCPVHRTLTSKIMINTTLV